MKILFYFTVAVAPDTGGVERVMSIMFERLVRLGHEIDIIYLCQTKSKNPLPNQIPLPSQYGNDIRNRVFIEALIEKNKYNIAFNFAAIFNKSSMAFVDACYHMDVPQVSIYHNTLDWALWCNNHMRRMMENKILRVPLKVMYGLFQKAPFLKNANYISRRSVCSVVLAKSYIPQYLKLVDSHPNHLTAIYNPMPPLMIPNMEAPKENVVLFIGRLTEQKNLTSLLRIWSKIDKDGWILRIVGSGDCEADLKKYSHTLCIEDSVEFCGSTSNPTIYYQEAKIMAMTSKYEGYPMTLIECQQFGCVPILFASFPAASEIVRDGYNGILIHNNDEDQFANRLQALMASPANLSALQLNCIDEKSRYSVDDIISQWEKLVYKYAKK